MIRDSIDSVIAKRADSAAQVFQLDHHDAIDKIVVPYAPIVGQAADIATTAIALQKGFIEVNPVMKPLVKSLPLFAALKLGVGVASCLIIKRLQNDGRDNAARVVSVLTTMAGAGPAINNLIQMNK